MPILLLIAIVIIPFPLCSSIPDEIQDSTSKEEIINKVKEQSAQINSSSSEQLMSKVMNSTAEVNNSSSSSSEQLNNKVTNSTTEELLI